VLDGARTRQGPARAKIHGEVTGYGSSADAFRITDSHDEGRGAIACMREALVDAKLNPEDVGYIKRPRTSTSVNDSIETLAIKRTFGDAASRVPISSTKSMMGHLIAAAGAWRQSSACWRYATRSCLLTRSTSIIPTRNATSTTSPTSLGLSRFDAALSNSFGFGGQKRRLDPSPIGRLSPARQQRRPSSRTTTLRADPHSGGERSPTVSQTMLLIFTGFTLTTTGGGPRVS